MSHAAEVKKPPFTFTMTSDRLRTGIRVLGELLITLGVIVFLFIGYELWFTGLYTEHAQRTLNGQLHHLWEPSPIKPGPSASGSSAASSPSGAPGPSPGSNIDEPVPGDAIGIIRIPRISASYSYAIVEGTTTDDLKKGPGHYSGSALPGQIGNLVISGHRTTYLAPFNALGELSDGDAIVIETKDSWYTYRVTGTRTVLPDEVGVLLPVPDERGEKPTKALITLTTCTPKYSASHRLVIDGQLTAVTPKSTGLPPALQGG